LIPDVLKECTLYISRVKEFQDSLASRSLEDEGCIFL
jgi:hypothetical protein